MIIGKVLNSIWSTRKEETLVGAKLLVVKTMDTHEGRIIVAIDLIGAGIGEKVLIAQGGSATRRVSGLENAPVDAVIVGIIDEGQNEPLEEVEK